MKECNGRIHSIETMGLVDGPGIRAVIFFQGCKLRCVYCHNPDTWNMDGGYDISPKELIQKILKYKHYFQRSNGGATFSGGECLLQDEFLLETLKLCKENGIHTAIDTSGCGNGDYEEILKYVDLVILDIKHVDLQEYKNITGQNMDEFNRFLKALKNSKNNVWIRHVVIPGITDSEEDILKLKEFIKGIDNVEKVQLLPYHTLGVSKYEKLNIPYRLKHTEAMDEEKLNNLQFIVDCNKETT
ncbi:Pyruvate formate-lyase-activating enzyme [Clostridium liquoris]|jgi:pyruvate formate lyase activating enzyme|uniref:Pyruvate formate-lyase-activating enzyme n=1 Tax=Clostridium liquoris TaxID=1289519 RepID=A0A2T0B868_9CLOT|nr:pyruvate formate-lyase-activating protein [Clostridium liquoris]PRR80076.1 Pyruvate formate-lyase-activating enzyme [Clostridium liquoris]